MKKKAFILTCVTESHEVVSVKAYPTTEKANNAMLVDYKCKLDSLLEEYTEDELCENSFAENRFATLVLDEKDYAYYWQIKEIEINF